MKGDVKGRGDDDDKGGRQQTRHSMYMSYCVPVTEYVQFLRSGHQHHVAVWGVPFLYIVLFFAGWPFCLY